MSPVQGKKRLTHDMPFDEVEPVPGHPGYYVTREGRVFSIGELSPSLWNDKYYRFQTTIQNEDGTVAKKRLGVHQAVCMAFHGPACGPGQEVRHLDGNPRNNHVDNLAWGTRKENAQDMACHGTVKGERASNVKFTESQVREIRRICKNGKRGIQQKLAIRYGVHSNTISAIVTRRNWGHI